LLPYWPVADGQLVQLRPGEQNATAVLDDRRQSMTSCSRTNRWGEVMRSAGQSRDTTEALPGFEDRAPRDRYCDLVLTGGVTSAIAYPAAVFALARVYRFNAVGGSSSGAGAAALAAAAEYRRRHGSANGFRTLLEQISEVGDDLAGRTRLAWLFQPGRGHARLFNAMVPAIALPAGTLLTRAMRFLRAYAPVIAVASILALLLVRLVYQACEIEAGFALFGFGLMAAAFTLIAAALSFAIALAGDVARVANDDYGLCNGLDMLPGAPHPPLTLWLHRLIQDIAGRAEDDAPLTFADLAGAPGSPRETLGDETAASAESIALRIFTANITHGRPYLFPLGDDDPQLYFRPGEMRRLFPRSVVEHMMRCKDFSSSGPIAASARVVEPAGSVKRGRRGPVSDCGADDAEWLLWPLPKESLPILVAARMSISFPVLFTAVPLWARDEEEDAETYRRCLFSDGGLCSNFPIHLFDSALPAWPTFGVSLHELADDVGEPGRGQARNCPGRATLPEQHWQGTEERWDRFDSVPRSFSRLFGFFSALLATMKNWNDAMLARLPGVRERVARIALPPGIGGLNILMTRDDIRSLAELGGEAARRLLERFSTPSAANGYAQGWNEHRWVRLHVLRSCLAETLRGLARAAAGGRHAMPLRDHIAAATEAAPLFDARDDPPSTALLRAQAAVLERALDALVEAERAFAAPDTGQPYTPHPQPRLTIRPPL
jgi:predicted acylesterase/phospholipase RssA